MICFGQSSVDFMFAGVNGTDQEDMGTQQSSIAIEPYVGLKTKFSCQKRLIALSGEVAMNDSRYPIAILA